MHIAWMVLTLEPARALARRFGSATTACRRSSWLTQNSKSCSAAFRERRPPQQDGVLSWTLRPVILTVKSIFDRGQLPRIVGALREDAASRRSGSGRVPNPAAAAQRTASGAPVLSGNSAFANRWPRASVDGNLGVSAVVSRCESTERYQRRLSVARRQRASFASSSWASYAAQDSGACLGSPATAAATMRK